LENALEINSRTLKIKTI